MRTRPYRNNRIISVIRDLYFMGGITSFASRFASDFPFHKDACGVKVIEVPIPMVALVATAVRLSHTFRDCHTNFDEQLYAALYEWRTGIHQTVGFSANAYLDVYQGHLDTFNHVTAERVNAFHTMMGDIYSQVT
jgi:hypothetical protein